MRAELKHIARPGGGGCAGGRGQRTPLVGLRFAANDDLVDFAESEARNLDRRIGKCLPLKFDLEFVDEPVNREPQQALLLAQEVVDPHARRPA